MDRDARGFMATMQGEYTMLAAKLEGSAREMEHQATAKRMEAEQLRQRAAWAGEAANALDPDAPTPRAKEADDAAR